MTGYWQALNPEAFHQGIMHGYRQGYRHGFTDGVHETDEADREAQDAFTRAAAKSARDAVDIHAARQRLRPTKPIPLVDLPRSIARTQEGT